MHLSCFFCCWSWCWCSDLLHLDFQSSFSLSPSVLFVVNYRTKKSFFLPCYRSFFFHGPPRLRPFSLSLSSLHPETENLLICQVKLENLDSLPTFIPNINYRLHVLLLLLLSFLLFLLLLLFWLMLLLAGVYHKRMAQVSWLMNQIDGLPAPLLHHCGQITCVVHLWWWWASLMIDVQW